MDIRLDANEPARMIQASHSAESSRGWIPRSLRSLDHAYSREGAHSGTRR